MKDGALKALGHAKTPYFGSFEFLAERLANEQLNLEELDSRSRNFEFFHRLNSLDNGIHFDFRGNIAPPGALDGGNRGLLATLRSLYFDEAGSVEPDMPLTVSEAVIN